MADENFKILWESPPPEVLEKQTPSTGRYALLAEALRHNPGKWAVLPYHGTSPKSAQQLTQHIRAGRQAGFAPRGDFEAVRDPDDGEHKGLRVWVRYAPKAKDAAKDTPKDAPKAPVPTPPQSTMEERAAQEERLRSFGPRVREWARTNGIEVASAGRLPEDLIEQFLKANPSEVRPNHLGLVR